MNLDTRCAPLLVATRHGASLVQPQVTLNFFFLFLFAGVRELFSIDGIAGQEKWKKNARFLPCISDERSEERQDGCCLSDEKWLYAVL